MRSRVALLAVVLCASAFTVQAQSSKSGTSRLMATEAVPPIHIRNLGSTGPIGYSPAQIRRAYNFDQIYNYTSKPYPGAGQTIGIVDAYGSPTVQRDLNTFCKRFGIPSTTVRIVYPQGKPRKVNSGWALETSLDVQWAHAIAPGARILLVVAKSNSLIDLLQAVDVAVKYGARQVSMSWGASEFYFEYFFDYHFDRKNVSFFASSGDNGAGVLWPAVSPFVIGVGGTTLNLDDAGNLTGDGEVAWPGSGGGASSYVLRPYFQDGWQMTMSRTTPDVSYNADPGTGFPVYSSVKYAGRAGWFTVGGTSAGAPQWAALTALVNAQRATLKQKALDFPQTAIYTAAGSPSTSTYSGDFRDVISGSNGYSASPFYDMVTGLGSPVANTLIPSLSVQP